MRVFVYEWATGGGLLGDPDEGVAKLAAEGRAMADAVAADFESAGVTVAMLRDTRLVDNEGTPDERQHVNIVGVCSPKERDRQLDHLCRRCDATVLIAPEFGGTLLNAARRVEALGVRLLSPSSRFIALTGNKQRTCEQLAEAAVPVPDAEAYGAGTQPPPDAVLPCVVKPVDGAGSVGSRVIQAAADWSPVPSGGVRVERYIPGQAASVAVIGGPAGVVAGPAMTQRVSVEGDLRYLGGESIGDERLNSRARRLALRAVSACPPLVGYAGVDLVLGADPSGAADVVIEINPRLTTSYCGLRHTVAENPARAMIEAAGGQPVSLTPNGKRVAFDAHGTIRVG